MSLSIQVQPISTIPIWGAQLQENLGKSWGNLGKVLGRVPLVLFLYGLV